MNSPVCKICHNSRNNRVYVVKEMMFGFRDEFEYIECNECGCLQISNIPENIDKYYPDNYYSYDNRGEDQIIQHSFSKNLKRSVKKVLLNPYLHNRLLGRIVSQKLDHYYPWMKKNILSSKSRILDVGCGTGWLLLQMYNDGFRHLMGVDPYINDDIHYKCGVTIYKKQLSEIKEKFDFIMLHHAFEHMDQPLAVLKNINQLLNPGGWVLIRIPIADSFAWENYGVNWVQLDAPRHFFLHTNKSIQIISRKSGFELTDVIYDSWELQFFGSEKYLRDIPLTDKQEIFSKKEMENYRMEARRLNEAKQGDSACFYLHKKQNL